VPVRRRGLVDVLTPTADGEHFAGCLIEESLAVDNPLVVAPIFGYFAVLRMFDADRHLMTALTGRAESESELDSHQLPAGGRLMTDPRSQAHQVANEPAESGRCRTERLPGSVVPGVFQGVLRAVG